jgi:hypothetical protein
MARESFSIQIKGDRRGQRTARLLPQWLKRTERFQRYLPYLAAKYVRNELLERIPKTEEWSAYRASLDIAKVTGTPRDLFAYTLRSNMRDRRVRQVDAPKTVLYVRSKNRLRRVKPEIEILEKYSPWTLQTIPFMPKRGDALVITRRVSKREIVAIEKKRLKDRPKWRRELDREGHREVKKDNKLKFPQKAHGMPDVAFEVLRLEFGLGGVKGKPHWRPSIRQLKTTGFKSMLRRDRSLKRVFTDPTFRGWKRWPPKTRNKVRIGEARNYLPFQKKLGIRR